MKENQMRGCLNEEIKEKYPKLTTEELRLIPYVQYCLVNQKPISNVNAQEIDILSKWIMDGYITNIHTRPKCSREFWDIINDILFMGYCPEMEDEL